MTDAPTPFRDGGPARERGFTLIELLIVLVIIGILAAIAMSGIQGYRTRAQDAAVKTDLRNAMTAQEAYFSDHRVYAAFSVASGGSNTDPDFNASANVSVTATLVGPHVRIVGSHTGSPNTWCLTSDGGAVQKGTSC